MNEKQYKKFEKSIKVKGYNQHDYPDTKRGATFYYTKGFCYDYSKEHPTCDYQIAYLVYDWRHFEGLMGESYGVKSVITTSSDMWPKIELELNAPNFDVSEVEQYASDFFHHFVLSYSKTK